MKLVPFQNWQEVPPSWRPGYGLVAVMRGGSLRVMDHVRGPAMDAILDRTSMSRGTRGYPHIFSVCENGMRVWPAPVEDIEVWVVIPPDVDGILPAAVRGGA